MLCNRENVAIPDRLAVQLRWFSKFRWLDPPDNRQTVKNISLKTLRELLRLSLPMVVSQGAFAAMIFTDRLFMSFIDSAHIAAALGGGVASFVCFSLFAGRIHNTRII